MVINTGGHETRTGDMKMIKITKRQLHVFVLMTFSSALFILWKAQVWVGTGSPTLGQRLLGVSAWPGTSQTSTKIILLWTNYYEAKNWIPGRVFSKCPVSSCSVTSDRSTVKNADVVVFHPRNIAPGPLPDNKWPHQRWLLFNMEPPYFNGIVPQRYNGLFNWTMTYRRDSDFVINYGEFSPLQYGEERTTVDLASKTKMAAVVISNCNAINGRIEYVRELQKYISVDFFGRCGDYECPKTNDCGRILQQYKFYLAFESGNCLNYISEKLWNPLKLWKSVPVVMGGASPRDYEAIAPPGSYINTIDFESPKSLANYLTKLDKDDKLYMEYHRWRYVYNIVTASPHVNGGWTRKMPENKAFCDLCAALHNNSVPAQVYTDLEQWYSKDTCPHNHPNLFCFSWDHCCQRRKTTDMFKCF